MASRTLVIKTKMENKDFHAQIRSMESDLERLKGDYEAIANGPSYSNQQQDLQDLEKEIEKATNKLSDFKKKQEEINNQGKFDLGVGIDTVNTKLTGTIKKVGRLALAFFGIRTVLSLISRATSIVTQNNEELANKIDAIKNTIAMTLEPIITRIVNLIQTLLQYVGYLIKAWTGKDIFASAKNNMKATAKSAKEVKKSLAGFDEMNTLQDNKSSSSDVGGGTIEALPQSEIPKWLQWIADNGDKVKEIILGIASAILVLKFNLNLLQGIGIFLILDGVLKLIKDIKDFIESPSWDKFSKVLKDIGEIALGIGLLFGNLPIAVLGAIVLLVGYIIEYREQIWDIIKKGAEVIITIFKAGLSVLSGMLTTVSGLIIAPFRVGFETVKSVLKDFWSAFKNIGDGIKKLLTGDIKGALNSFKSAFKNVFDALVTIAKAPINLIIEMINALIRGANKIKIDVPSWVLGIGGKTWGFNIGEIPKLAKGGIVNNPGRGVNMGSYIAGERGPEAVLPLNAETFDGLGTAIAKHITINATIENKMNGRTISRELAKINNSNSFASNR